MKLSVESLTLDTTSAKEVKKNYVICSMARQLLVLDPDTGAILSNTTCDSDIVGFAPVTQNRILVGTKNGGLYRSVVGENSMLIACGATSNTLAQMQYQADTDRIVLLTDTTGKAFLYQPQQDTDLSMLPLENVNSSNSSIAYGSGYRIIVKNAYNDTDEKEIFVYQTGSSEELLSIPYSDHNKKIENTTVLTCNGSKMLFYTTCSFAGGTEDLVLHGVDLVTKQELITRTLSDLEQESATAQTATAQTATAQTATAQTSTAQTSMAQTTGSASTTYADTYQLLYSPNTESVVVYKDASFAVLSLTDGRILQPYTPVLTADDTGTIMRIFCAENGKKLVFTGASYALDEQGNVGSTDQSLETEQSSYYIRIWDVDTASWDKISDSDTYLLPYQEGYPMVASDIVVSEHSLFAAIYTATAGIRVVDLATGTQTGSYQVAVNLSPQMSFLNEDQNLIVTGSGMATRIWDLQTQTLVLESSDAIENVTTLLTADGSHYIGVMEYGSSSVASAAFRYTLHVYYIDENQQIYPWATVRNATADMGEQEIISFGDGSKLGYGTWYSFAELKEKAERLSSE